MTERDGRTLGSTEATSILVMRARLDGSAVGA